MIVKDLTQIQMRGDEEIMTKIIAEEEEERMRTNQLMTSPIAPTTAPIEPTTACGTINTAYISYSVQNNNILRSHQIIFSATEVEPPYVPEEEGDWMRQEKYMSMMLTTTMTMTVSGAINGVYILSPVQHNNFSDLSKLFLQQQMTSIFATMMRIMSHMIMTLPACMRP